MASARKELENGDIEAAKAEREKAALEYDQAKEDRATELAVGICVVDLTQSKGTYLCMHTYKQKFVHTNKHASTHYLTLVALCVTSTNNGIMIFGDLVTDLKTLQSLQELDIEIRELEKIQEHIVAGEAAVSSVRERLRAGDIEAAKAAREKAALEYAMAQEDRASELAVRIYVEGPHKIQRDISIACIHTCILSHTHFTCRLYSIGLEM